MIASLIDMVGFLAAGATIAAFYCTRMLTLRTVAIVANLLFIAYGAVLDLKPVLALHCLLLPLNIVRLREAWREGRAERALPIARAVSAGLPTARPHPHPSSSARTLVSRSRHGSGG